MQCNNFDITGYWRLRDAYQELDKLDKNRLCHCWIPREDGPIIPDLFCKPKGGCGDVSSGKERVLAQMSPSGFKCEQ